MAVLAAGVLLAFAQGRYSVSLADLARLARARLTTQPSGLPVSVETVVWQIRGPRVLAALAVGAALSRLPLRERALLLAYVPQVAATGFGFLAREVVLMGRTTHGGLFARPSAHDHAVVAAALARLGIADLADRPVTQISGGERQLVLVARALAQEPRAVVLDEPTASLDFGNQGRVLREIRRLAEAGLAVLFTTHDPNQALRYADQVLLIRDGGTMAQGSVRELIDAAHLRTLYGADVEELADGSSGRRAYLPG